MFETVERIQAIAAELGIHPVTLAVSWVMANPVVTAPIVGASRPDQLGPSLAAAERPLAPDVKARLDALTAEYRRGDAAR